VSWAASFGLQQVAFEVLQINLTKDFLWVVQPEGAALTVRLFAHRVEVASMC